MDCCERCGFPNEGLSTCRNCSVVMDSQCQLSARLYTEADLREAFRAGHARGMEAQFEEPAYFVPGLTDSPNEDAWVAAKLKEHAR